MSVLEQTSTTIPAGTWNADKAHSIVEFAIRHMKIVTVRGEFTDYEASIDGGDQPTLNGVIRTASVATRDEQRDAHLRSPEFFDTDRYPEATVVVRDLHAGRVTAELSLRGVTRELELDVAITETAVDPWGNTRVGLELSGLVERADFGLSWNAPLPGGGFLLDDQVKLSASLSFVKAA